MTDAARTPLFSPANAAALLLGMLLATRLSQLPPVWVIATVLLLGVVGWLRGRHGWQMAAVFLLGLGLLMGQGAWRMASVLPTEMELREATVSGRIVELPLHEERRTRFDLIVDDADDQPEALRGYRLRLSWYDAWRSRGDPDRQGPRWQLKAGERWRFRVKLRAPRGLRNPAAFDGERQMLLDGIAAAGHVSDTASAQRIGSPAGIVAWREYMAIRIAEDTRAKSGRFIAALALGDTRGLSVEDWEALRAAGLTHLIAISGFHVGLVGLGLAALAWGLYQLWPTLGRYCPRRVTMAGAATLGAFVYLLATGASLPTLRTVLMIAFVACALILRRQTGVAQSLAVALMLVLMMDPLCVLRPGFWLSFGGVAWLAWCLQGIQAGHVRQFLAAQAVASLGLLPLAVIFFAQASLVGPLANLVAVPWWSGVVVPLALLGTTMEVLHVGWGTPLWTLAGIAFDISWPLFEWLASSRLALIWIPQSAVWALPLALVGMFALLMPRGMPGRALAATLALPLLWPNVDQPETGEIDIVQMDVGQGTAMLVRTRHHSLLYDAGPATPQGFDAGERSVLPLLHAYGVGRLDTLILSHADADHAGGRDAIAQAIPIEHTLAPPDAPLPEVVACEAGQEWTWDGVRFRFLHPTTHFPYLKNQSSCVLRIETAHGAALLTGDIDDLIESRLLQLAKADLHAEVVTVPHHGSGGSSSEAFVEATGARLALISSGYANRFRHPRDNILARWQKAGAKPLISSELGAVQVRIGEDGVEWKAERLESARFWDAVARHPREAGLSYRPTIP